MKDYSQHGEQKYILDYFQDQPEGTFLDIGAYDGITFSNTRALLNRKLWQGVAIEASPLSFVNLCKNLDGFDVKKICALVLPDIPNEQKLHRFWDSGGDAISTMYEDQKTVWENECAFKEIYLAGITIPEFITKFTRNYDFINIDVEGGSVELFEEVLRKMMFKLICVEHDGKVDHCHSLAALENLEIIHVNGVNAIYGR